MSIPADARECLSAKNILVNQIIHLSCRPLGKIPVMMLSDIMKFDAGTTAKIRSLHSIDGWLSY